MTFEQFNIRIPNGSTGNIKTICPACTPHNRKPSNRNSKDLSVNVPDGVWNCHNCGWKGTLRERKERKYERPTEVKLPLSAKTIKYFKDRGINETTLQVFGITEKMEFMPQVNKEMNCLLFPYRRNGEWVNVKYRDGAKHFRMTKDAELIMFNIDAVQGQKKVAITEGEIDAMSLFEVGFQEVCSVPNGATKGNNRLEYLDNSWLAFADAEEILLFTDNDEAGIALKGELSRRLGKERCREVNYPDGCKDVNEVLVKHGHTAVWECLKSAKSLPVDGIYRLTDFVADLDKIYQYGFEPGVKVGYSDFDELLNFSPGQLTMITGVPNSGKSAFLDQLLVRLAEQNKWQIGVCSFEQQPIERHAALLSSVYTGEPFFDRQRKMKVDTFTRAKQFLYNHFFWFKMTDEDLSLDGILNRARQLVVAYGIRVLVIDPYNYMEHKRPAGMSETEYVSQILTELCNFNKKYDVHTFLVAHPTKIRKNPATKDFEIPTLYDISGSANFFNKTDNGFTVYRDRSNDKVTVYMQKVRFRHNGKLGSADFSYDVNCGRYSPFTKEQELMPTNPEPPPPKPNAGFQGKSNRPPAEFWNND